MAKKQKQSTEALKSMLVKAPRKVLKPEDYLHTGSSMVNLGITGFVDRGIAKGTFALLVGGSSAGKTWLAHTCFAEATISEAFKNHRLIYDPSENGALMDLEFYFGKKVADRLEWPRVVDDKPVYSKTVEEMCFAIDDAFDVGRPFIFVEDSIDGLSSNPEQKKFDEHKEANRKGIMDVKGDFGDGKPKILSRGLRTIVSELERTDSILIILNQTRDNINAGPWEPKDTRSGGRALEFYAHTIAWMKVAGHVEKTLRGKKRELGVLSRIKIRKNRTTGRVREVTIPILHSFGIDDLGSMVDYLLDEKIWKSTDKGIVTVTGLGPEFTGRRDAIIKRIEDDGLEDDLKAIVQSTWDEIEEALKVKRKSRYS